MRLILKRILVIEDSYECVEDFILIKDNRIDWFFRLDTLETIYDEEIRIEECQNRILIDIFILTLLHSKQFHEVDWFKSTFRSFR